jgi:hypothetical protein
MADLGSEFTPHLEAGEELRGLCVASQQRGWFSGGAVVIGVTDRRLVIQPLSRRGEPDGEVQSIAPAEALAEWFRAIEP